MKVKKESEKASLKLNIQKTKLIASGSITSLQVDGGKVEIVTDSIFGGPKITADMKLKDACSLKKNYDKPRQHIEKQRHHFANKHPSIQSYCFYSSHVQM